MVSKADSHNNPSKKKVHLVLGSGGARGIAHIAVIEGLLNDGFEIIEVIGCSMGAIIGGIYATGHMDEYKEWILNMTKREVFELSDFTFTKRGFLKGEKIFEKHKDLIGNYKIENLNIPFTAIATDIKHQKEIYFKTGDLYEAMRASSSIPGVYVPIAKENAILVDGGVLNPLPINLVKPQENAIVVAVNVNAKSSVKNEIEEELKEPYDPKWYERILPDNFLDFAKNTDEQKQDVDYSIFDLMNNTYNLTQDRLVDVMLDHYHVDLLIDIPRNTASTFEFHKAKEIYEKGVDCYEKAMQKFKTKKASNITTKS